VGGVWVNVSTRILSTAPAVLMLLTLGLAGNVTGRLSLAINPSHSAGYVREVSLGLVIATHRPTAVPHVHVLLVHSWNQWGRPTPPLMPSDYTVTLEAAPRAGGGYVVLSADRFSDARTSCRCFKMKRITRALRLNWTASAQLAGGSVAAVNVSVPSRRCKRRFSGFCLRSSIQMLPALSL